MKNTCPFHIVFQVLKVLRIKICNVRYSQPPDLLFLVDSFYISRYNFSQIFIELHSTLPEKRNLITDFSFLTDSLKLPPPLTAKIRQFKRGKSFLPMLPYTEQLPLPISISQSYKKFYEGCLVQKLRFQSYVDLRKKQTM